MTHQTIHNDFNSLRDAWGRRVFIYLAGLLTLAIGVSLSTVTGLGISPLNVLAYVISHIFEIKMGYATMAIFAVYIVIEMAVKGKHFRPFDLLQFVCAILFGYFVNWTKALISDIALSSYLMKLICTGISTFFIALGTTLYVSAKIVPQAPEGLIMAICDRWNGKFANVKLAFDVVSVSISAAVALVFTGSIIGIREGTLIMAVFVGVVVKILERRFRPMVESFCLGFHPVTPG